MMPSKSYNILIPPRMMVYCDYHTRCHQNLTTFWYHLGWWFIVIITHDAIYHAGITFLTCLCHPLFVESMSEWLLFNTHSAIFQLYHGETKLIFNERMMWSALYKSNTLSLICIMVAHWNNSMRIKMSLHSDTVSWFRANQSLLFLLDA